MHSSIKYYNSLRKSVFFNSIVLLNKRYFISLFSTYSLNKHNTKKCKRYFVQDTHSFTTVATIFLNPIVCYILEIMNKGSKSCCMMYPFFALSFNKQQRQLHIYVFISQNKQNNECGLCKFRFSSASAIPFICLHPFLTLCIYFRVRNPPSDIFNVLCTPTKNETSVNSNTTPRRSRSSNDSFNRLFGSPTTTTPPPRKSSLTKHGNLCAWLIIFSTS